MEYYSGIKQNEITPFAATWMDLEIIILSQWKTNIVWYHLHVESNKNDINELIYKKQTHKFQKQTMVTKGET